MDPNLQTILLGLLTNALTSFIAQFGRRDSKLLLGEELLKKMKWEETALQPILQKAAQMVAERIEWQGVPKLEIVCSFLTSPEAETIVRQIYAAKLSVKEEAGDLASIQREFLTSFYLCTTSYSSYTELKEDQLVDSSKLLLDALIEGCDQALNVAIDEGKLSAHEAKSAFRHRLILDELAALHENVTFLTSQQKPNVKEILAFEEIYRRQVGNRHKYITPPNFGKVRQLHINKLYVPPNFIITSSEKEEKQEILSSQENPSSAYRKVLLGTFRAVLLGNPGGGKSTFTHKLCYDLVTHYSERLFGGRRNVTPILVILRDYGTEKKMHHSSILEFIQAKAKADYQLQPPLGAFEYLLLNGRAIVIFDGLDELLDTRDRQEISKAVEAFCTLYPSVPVLVTSREVGYEQAPLDEEIFEIFRLASFSEDQVQEYVKKWFDVTTDMLPEQQKQKAKSFFEESKMVPDLRSNPLMLALLCNIYREENYIPKNRPDVYEKCANMLFERWDRSRGIQVNLPFEVHLRPTMMYLAYWIYAGQGLRGGVTEERLIAKTTEYLSQKLFEDEAQKVAHEFIEFCKGRAWVFTNTGSTKQGEELYQFTHQTFLEYFTAAYLCRTHPTAAKLLNILRPRIVKREWDVVAQLAFQIQNKNVEGAGNYLLSSLIKQTQTAGDERWNLLSFAVRCLEFMIPSPYVIQDIVLACIRHSLTWGIDQSKKLPSQNKHDYPKPEEIISYLLNAATDNRKTIAFNLENLLIAQVTSNNDSEAVLAAEIGLYLQMFLHVKPPRVLIHTNFRLADQTVEFWQSISDRLMDSCSQQLKILSQKHLQICARYLLTRGEISISDVIKWYGIESIFKDYRCTMLPSSSWFSIGIQLLLMCAHFPSLPQNSQIPPIYLNAIKEVGSFLLSCPPPWIRGQLFRSNFVTFPLQEFISYRPQSKNAKKRLNADPDVLFGLFVLLILSLEVTQKVSDRQIKWHYLGGETSDVIQAIKSSTHPILQSIRWMLIARYESSELDLGQKPTIIDNVEAEMNSCKFTIEQQNFIWRWLRQEVEVIDNSTLF
jgi:hypothetical protein